MNFRDVMASCLGISLVLSGLPGMAAAAVPTRVGTAKLDPQARALVIPYQGQAPAVKLQKLAPMHYIADLDDAMLAREEVQSQAVGGKPLLAGWSLDETPTGHVVRLRLTLKQDIDPSQLHFERVGHTLRLTWGEEAPRFQLAHRSLPDQAAFVLPKAPKALALPTGAAMGPAPVAHRGPAALGAPHFDAKRNCLVVPMAGTVDPAKLNLVHLGKRWAYLDLPVKPNFSGMRYQDRPNQAMQRWVMAKRPRQNVTRISFNVQAGTALDVKLAGKELLVAVRPKAPAAPALTAVLPAAPVPVARKANQPSRPAPVPVAAAPKATSFNRPYYDQGRRALVLPYAGELPLYRFNNQTAQSATVEVKGLVAPMGKLEERFRRNGLMDGWQAQRDPQAGTVKVTLNFRRPSELVVAADPGHKQLLLLPQPRVAGDDLSVAEAPVGTLSAARLPADGRELLIPYTGQAPAFIIEQVSATQVYVNFERSKLDANGVQYAEPAFHPTINHWLLSERPGQHLVRLAVTLRQPGGLQIFRDRTNQRLVVALDGAEPKVGHRTRSQRPADWPDEQRLVGKKAS